MLFAGALGAEPAPDREREVAYCNTDSFAIKIYTPAISDQDPEAPSAEEAFVRIYNRSDDTTFINHTPVSQESIVKNGIAGMAYENLRGENQWQLFVASNPGAGFDPESPNADPDAGIHQCLLSRDGDVLEYGEGRLSGAVGGSGYYPGTSGGHGSGGDSSRPAVNQE